MTKPPKLYANLLVNAAQTVSFATSNGCSWRSAFIWSGRKGVTYIHPAVPRPMIVQPRGSDAKPYQFRQFLDMVEEFGLGLEE